MRSQILPATPPLTASPLRAPLLVIAGGLTAGVIDITYAIVFWAFKGVAATRVLHSVASGLLGTAAHRGGWGTAALGLFLHFVIALLLSVIFYALSRRFRFLVARPILWGATYGFAVFWVMNLVVLPLSAFPRAVTFAPLPTITGILVHMFGVGVPIALAARRAR